MSILLKHKINWQYAIGEVILILIGITLTISFNNWNEIRNQKNELERQRIEYIRAIYADILNESKNIQYIREQFNLLIINEYSSADTATSLCMQ